MAGIKEFELGEGVDGSGVTTKILTCNCSMDLVIENKSKLFGLHIQPPLLQMFFGSLPFAISRVSICYLLQILPSVVLWSPCLYVNRIYDKLSVETELQ